MATIKRGDLVRVTSPEAGSANGKEGLVVEIMRADRNYERRARVRISSGYQPTLAMRFLEPADEVAK